MSLILNILENRRNKGNHLQHLRILKADASRTHVELLFFVETTDSSSMRTFHIISIDFELRFRIHLGPVRKQNIVILLISLRSLGILCHYDLAIEIHAGLSTCNTLEKLTRVAVRYLVIHVHCDSDLLVSTAYIGTIDISLRSFAQKLHSHAYIA